jgi:hypothetical protein
MPRKKSLFEKMSVVSFSDDVNTMCSFSLTSGGRGNIFGLGYNF